jgi:hypothetical protein
MFLFFAWEVDASNIDEVKDIVQRHKVDVVDWVVQINYLSIIQCCIRQTMLPSNFNFCRYLIFVACINQLCDVVFVCREGLSGRFEFSASRGGRLIANKHNPKFPIDLLIAISTGKSLSRRKQLQQARNGDYRRV